MNALNAEYSESGSTKKKQETAVMAYFNRYVEEAEDSREYLTCIRGNVIQKVQLSQGESCSLIVVFM